MKRRVFLKNAIPAAAFVPAIINGMPVHAYPANTPFLQSLLNGTTDTDHVLVLIQLSGGNDGLNTVIPVEFYAGYLNARNNIAIPQNKVLGLNGNVTTGLHPSMTGMQTLYNEGQLAIIQAVGYPTPNFSHFRATDIWMSASDADQVVSTGWAGRYLNTEYPNFPTGYPNPAYPDPLAIQIGSITSLALQGPSISMGMSISDPTSFYNFLNGVEDPAPNTPAGKELTYIRLVARQTQQYADVIKTAATKGNNLAGYPTGNSNYLADQLKVVARLISGGLKTRVYMVQYGSFDNHSSQVNSTDTTTGTHAKLLQQVSDAIKVFMDDLRLLNVDNRVVGMTFSEFGRRMKSNSSLGTDHGAAAPLFVFGKNVKGAVIGSNPTIPATVGVGDNVPFQYDFRSIYASLLSQWFCVNSTNLKTIMFKDFQSIPLIANSACTVTGLDDVLNNAGDQFILNYPNPFVNTTKITFRTRGGDTMIQIIDNTGRTIRVLANKNYLAGVYNVDFDSEGLAPGVFYARFQNGAIQQVHAMLKVR